MPNIRQHSRIILGFFLVAFVLFNNGKILADEIIVEEDVSITATVGGGFEDDEEDVNSSGSGGSLFVPASVTFSGIAYPNSPVFILKNGQDFMQTTANSNALFYVSVSGLSAGSYTFSVVTEDTNLRRSTLYTFPLLVSQNVATSIAGIFLSPTIHIGNSTIKKGAPLTILGQGAPNAVITISVKSLIEQFFSIETGSDGVYSKVIDTNFLSYGLYQTKSKSGIPEDDKESPFSSLISFDITEYDKEEVGCEGIMADVNCDYRVNLIDFSILAFWYRKDNPPESVDLLVDGKVDIRDFSILAYAWTG